MNHQIKSSLIAIAVIVVSMISIFLYMAIYVIPSAVEEAVSFIHDENTKLLKENTYLHNQLEVISMDPIMYINPATYALSMQQYCRRNSYIADEMGIACNNYSKLRLYANPESGDEQFTPSDRPIK